MFVSTYAYLTSLFLIGLQSIILQSAIDQRKLQESALSAWLMVKMFLGAMMLQTSIIPSRLWLNIGIASHRLCKIKIHDTISEVPG